MSDREYQYHYNGVTLRVTGEGNLQLRMISLGGTKQKVMNPLVMSPATEKTLTRGVNFKQSRAQLEIKVTEFDENFLISEILIFAKPVSKAYPK